MHFLSPLSVPYVPVGGCGCGVSKHSSLAASAYPSPHSAMKQWEVASMSPKAKPNILLHIYHPHLSFSVSVDSSVVHIVPELRNINTFIPPPFSIQLQEPVVALLFNFQARCSSHSLPPQPPSRSKKYQFFYSWPPARW